MTLGFKKEINGKEMHFAEKIWSAIFEYKIVADKERFEFSFSKKAITKVAYPGKEYGSKIHTIREDKGKRWRAGMPVHAAYDNRTKKRLQFAPTFMCKSVQYIKIEPISRNVWIASHKRMLKFVLGLCDSEVLTLAVNDGFDSAEDFYEYFNSSFAGKIIHFTDFKY